MVRAYDEPQLNENTNQCLKIVFHNLRPMLIYDEVTRKKIEQVWCGTASLLQPDMNKKKRINVIT